MGAKMQRRSGFYIRRLPPQQSPLPEGGYSTVAFATLPLPPRVARATATEALLMGELARLAVTERGEKILRNIPSRVILSEPSGESTFCGVPQKRCGL